MVYKTYLAVFLRDDDDDDDDDTFRPIVVVLPDLVVTIAEYNIRSKDSRGNRCE